MSVPEISCSQTNWHQNGGTDSKIIYVDANGNGLYWEVRQHPRNPEKKEFWIDELRFKSYRAKHKVASWWRYNSPIWDIWGKGSLLASKKCVCTVSKRSDQWYRRLAVHRQTENTVDSWSSKLWKPILANRDGICKIGHMSVDHMTIEILCADLLDAGAKFVGVM